MMFKTPHFVLRSLCVLWYRLIILISPSSIYSLFISLVLLFLCSVVKIHST